MTSIMSGILNDRLAKAGYDLVRQKTTGLAQWMNAVKLYKMIPKACAYIYFFWSSIAPYVMFRL